jgi:hypothetical protein
MSVDGDFKTFDTVAAEELRILRPPAADRGPDERPLSALCISGGGIRSATFALGAIQGLAAQGVLAEFDYLSTVSGGGYIGGWLTSWKQRAGGLDRIVPNLCPGGPPPKTGSTDPIGHLREYNNYLSPKFSLFSADTWTLAATVIRNMALNWLVLIPLLMFALMAPRLILALARLGETIGPFYGVTAQPIRAILVHAIPIVGGLFFAIATLNIMRYLPGVGNKNHTEKDFLKYCLGPIVFAALSFMTYDSWFDPSLGVASGPMPGYLAMLLWFTGSCAAGWVAYLAFCVRGLSRRIGLLFGPLSFAVLSVGIGTATAAWLLATQIYPNADWSAYVTVGPPLLLLAFLAAGALFVGLTSKTLGDEDHEWLARGGAWMLLFLVCWTAVCGLVLIAPAWIFSLSTWLRSDIAAAGGIAGYICALAGFGSKSSPGKKTGNAAQGAKAGVMNLVAKLAAPVFVVTVFIGLAILTNCLMAVLQAGPGNSTMHEKFLENTRAEGVLAVALAFLAIGWIAARFININKFSLHAMYRNRLIRAYLGASNDRSNANKFTGFAEADNIGMAALNPELKPFHVVNITLNLVSGDRLAWQQRKAESFTVSPLHSGSARLGYRTSREYGGRDGISLGTAITISGAAASPSMGYHSSPVIGFIMTLFNARLGAWLGNPGDAGEDTWRQAGPTSAVASLVREAFGLANDASDYVHLSDGGHFENLALYEMVMRRCGRILVLDSGCDPTLTYEDLGNALRKIRIDMGYPIDFDSVSLQRLRDRKQRWAFATIRYSAVKAEYKDGILVYLKPMMLGDESPDVATYQASHKDFPHQSTSDQWYDESQTESYRMLGLQTVQDTCSGWDRTGGISALFDHLSGVRTNIAAVGGQGKLQEELRSCTKPASAS